MDEPISIPRIILAKQMEDLPLKTIATIVRMSKTTETPDKAIEIVMMIIETLEDPITEGITLIQKIILAMQMDICSKRRN